MDLRPPYVRYDQTFDVAPFVDGRCKKPIAESASANFFVEFVALIIQNKIYICLMDKMH